MLDISKENKDILVNEIDYVCNKILKSSIVSESIYYFSAIHGIVHRIMNLEFSTDLVFLHFILRHIFDSINSRVQVNVQGDILIQLDKSFFAKLSELLNELKNNIDSGSDINATLKKLVILTYSMTGNGYYLFEKNNFDVFQL